MGWREPVDPELARTFFWVAGHPPRPDDRLCRHGLPGKRRAQPASAWLDSWRPWLAVTIALVVIACGPVPFSIFPI